ncbi:uncharacterized protein METZ01_LOCUS359449, partial [marine metagenome]
MAQATQASDLLETIMNVKDLME